MTELESYLTLSEAARKYGVSTDALMRLVKDGIIRAVRVDGGVLVAEGDVQTLSKREELWRRVESLDGIPIGLEEACNKYRISSPSLYRWIDAGYIRVLEDRRGGGRGKKRLLNEADVAYAELVAKERGRRRGRRIFTTEYLPPHAAVSA